MLLVDLCLKLVLTVEVTSVHQLANIINVTGHIVMEFSKRELLDLHPSLIKCWCPSNSKGQPQLINISSYKVHKCLLVRFTDIALIFDMIVVESFAACDMSQYHRRLCIMLFSRLNQMPVTSHHNTILV